MRRNNVIRGCIIIIMIMMICFLVTGNVVAEESGGPKTIAGMVYNSDGKAPSPNSPGKYNGTYAAVIVMHNGVKETHKDDDGLQWDYENGTYWYAVTIDDGAWDVGDRYWIWIDGSDWGDEDFTCTEHGDPDKNSWKMNDKGSEWLDVDTADYNFKPPIAWLFAVILGIIGIIVGVLRPLKLPASGWPRRASDLTDELLIVGTAVIPEELPEKEGEAAEKEHTCTICNGPLDYIKEYDRWYCYKCKKYAKDEPAPSDESSEPATGSDVDPAVPTPPEGAEGEPPSPPDELPPPEGGA